MQLPPKKTATNFSNFVSKCQVSIRFGAKSGQRRMQGVDFYSTSIFTSHPCWLGIHQGTFETWLIYVYCTTVPDDMSDTHARVADGPVSRGALHRAVQEGRPLHLRRHVLLQGGLGEARLRRRVGQEEPRVGGLVQQERLWRRETEGRRGKASVNSIKLPNQQLTLDKLPTELRCRNYVTKHRLSIQIGAKRAKTCVQRVVL